MDSEPAADPERSGLLSPSLHEWLDERFAALGMERETLLAQLLGAYRTVATLEKDEFATLFEMEAFGSAVERAIDLYLESNRKTLVRVERRANDIKGRIGDVEAKLANNVQDVRNRVLQLQYPVEGRASKDHDHPETDELTERIDTLSADLDDMAEKLRPVAEGITVAGDRFEDVETKLVRLARVVVALKRGEEAGSESDDAFNRFRRNAHRDGTTKATCDGFGETIRIDLLTDAVGPHCERRLEDLEQSVSLLPWSKSPILSVEETGFFFPADRNERGGRSRVGPSDG